MVKNLQAEIKAKKLFFCLLEEKMADTIKKRPKYKHGDVLTDTCSDNKHQVRITGVDWDNDGDVWYSVVIINGPMENKPSSCTEECLKR